MTVASIASAVRGRPGVVGTVLSPLVLISAVALLATLGSAGLQRAAITMIVLAIAVLGLHLFSGLSGVLSFGHAAFVAIGAYGSAILTVPAANKADQFPALPDLLANAELAALPAAVIVALACTGGAYLVGVPLMRLAGLGASLATFAVLQIVYVTIAQWDGVTGGQQNVFGLPATTTLWTALAWLWALAILVSAYQSSKAGLRLRASREDEAAARSLGVDVAAERRRAFALSAGIACVAGALYGHLLGTFSPDSFYMGLTFIIIAMLIVGGLGSIGGALIGAVVVSALQELLRQLESGVQVGGMIYALPAGSVEVALGLILLVVLLLRPHGITSGREWVLNRLR